MAKQLLNGRFAPLTYSIGFLEIRADIAFPAYKRWTTETCKNVEYFRLSGGNLAGALLCLEPLSTLRGRTLLLSTKSDWLAYFDNGLRGPDPFSTIGHLSQQLGCRGVIVTSVPHTLESDTGTARGTYGAVQFQLFGRRPTEFLNIVRTIAASYDDPWVFELSGDVQPFEDPSRYEQPDIRDRFTPEMLRTYCEALDIRLVDEDFYCGPGLLSVIKSRLPEGARELSLREARGDLGLD